MKDNELEGAQLKESFLQLFVSSNQKCSNHIKFEDVTLSLKIEIGN